MATKIGHRGTAFKNSELQAIANWVQTNEPSDQWTVQPRQTCFRAPQIWLAMRTTF